MQTMKNYIKNVKPLKEDMSERKSKADIKHKGTKLRSELFLGEEVKSSIAHLEEVFRKDVKVMKDDKILTREADLPKELQKMDKKSNMLHRLLESSNSVVENQIDNIMKRYNEINKMKDTYYEAINRKSTVTGISKQELFNKSKLRINLPRFSGYDTKLVIYSFQKEFTKIYKRTTPKRMMPDILKNNLLEESALSLVLQVQVIDEIWARLKAAYGNPKLLPKKKITEISRISQLWKLNNPDKLVNALTQIINIMKDLQMLASEHGIDSRLYSGNGIERIYQLLGDNRVTRWLSTMCGEL